MRARDAARLSAIRLLLAAIKQREVDERIELGDAEVVAVVEKRSSSAASRSPSSKKRRARISSTPSNSSSRCSRATCRDR